MTKKEKQAKIALVMREFAGGKLTSGGKPVKSKQQALAIALSEAGMSMKKKDASAAYLEAYVDAFMEERGDAESFSPPSSVRAAARRGLELRKKHGKGGLTTQEAGKQGIGSGVARAGDLAGGGGISFATIAACPGPTGAEPCSACSLSITPYAARHDQSFAGRP